MFGTRAVVTCTFYITRHQCHYAIKTELNGVIFIHGTIKRGAVLIADSRNDSCWNSGEVSLVKSIVFGIEWRLKSKMKPSIRHKVTQLAFDKAKYSVWADLVTLLKEATHRLIRPRVRKK